VVNIVIPASISKTTKAYVSKFPNLPTPLNFLKNRRIDITSIKTVISLFTSLFKIAAKFIIRKPIKENILEKIEITPFRVNSNLRIAKDLNKLLKKENFDKIAKVFLKILKKIFIIIKQDLV
jgi:hypothetical protein